MITARFDEGVQSINNEYFEVHDIISKIFGEEACEQIPAINAVCNTCLDKSIEMINFKNLYKECTRKLHNVLDNLNTVLNVDYDTTGMEQLYIEYEEDDKLKLYFIKTETNTWKSNNKCTRCNNTLENLNDFVVDNTGHPQTNTCKKCSQESEEFDNVAHEECDERCAEDSLENVDENDIKHICKQCGKRFRKLSKLLKHEEKHVESYMCSKCGKTYLTKDFYTKHISLCLEDKIELHPRRSQLQKRYICQECGKGYSAPGGLRVHIRFAHEKAKLHVCKECGKGFTAPSHLKAHMVTHTKERKFSCENCGGKFVTKEALVYHIRRHTGEKPYSCNQCDERFVNASARAEHVKFKHVGPTLQCHLCPGMFVTKNFLRLHMKKHLDPANKLYIGRANIPANMPLEQNMRIRSL